MSNAVSGSSSADSGFSPPGARPDYKSYRSPYGPQYTVSANFHGITVKKATRLGLGLGLFGGALGVAGVFFLADIPRFRNDVMQKLPIVGSYYIKEIPPEDNPF